MDFEPNYGSSEYSPKAEELFAGFLLDVERAQLDPESGAAPDFEQFCVEHDAYADELYGLHADWDNVRGLVAQMNGLRPRALAPAPVEVAAPTPSALELAEREAKIEPFSADDVPDSREEVHVSSLQRWKNLSTAMVTLAILASLWAANQFRNSRVLAMEKGELMSEQQVTREELVLAHSTGEALAAEGKQLADKLRNSEAAKGELESTQVVLTRDLDEARAGHEKLQLTQKQLEANLRAEQEKREEAAAQAQAAKDLAARLAMSVEAADLLNDESSLWPTHSIKSGALEHWLDQAEALKAQWTSSAGSSAEAPGALAKLLSQSGPIARTRARLARLNEWNAEARAEAGSPWSEALAQINDPSETPEFAGPDLVPQFGLVPIGRSSKTGLWRFADLQTGALPEIDEAGEVQAAEGSALVFLLIPGVELEGQSVAPFFVCETPWTPQHHLQAFGIPEPAADSALQARIAYEKALVQLGYEPLSSLQAMLAKPYGLQVTSWGRFPARAVEP